MLPHEMKNLGGTAPWTSTHSALAIEHPLGDLQPLWTPGDCPRVTHLPLLETELYLGGF